MNMNTPQACHPNSLDQNNSQATSSNASSPPCRADSAASNLADSAESHSSTQHAISQDPFAYYKAFMSTSVPSGSGPIHYDNGYTSYSEITETHATQYNGSQQQPGPRSGPYNLAVRLANRSNGETLATIIEQGSYSTLTSHSSHLSVARFPSIRVIENVSPKHDTRRASQGRVEKLLQNIQEDCPPEHDAPIKKVFYATQDEQQARPNTVYNADTRLKSDSLEVQQTPANPSSQKNHEQNKGLMSFFRGVLHNVRSASLSESRTPSISISIHAEDRRETLNRTVGNAKSQPQRSQLVFDQAKSSAARSSLRAQDSTSSLLSVADPLEPTPESQAEYGAGLSAGSDRVSQSVIHHSTSKNESHTRADLTPYHLLPMGGARDQPSSALLVLPETRDTAVRIQSTATGVAPQRHSRSDITAGITGNNAPSRGEYDRLRAVSRTASFCSTRSTSYSGTVLGVDLDLLQDRPSSVRRSPTPVWFTPQMDELVRQASSSESPRLPQAIAGEASRRSIVSSALPTLLPIAEASGIVRPNYTTPKISFFSPSGNLIQSEESSISRGSQSEYQGTPTATTSYYQNTDPTSAYNELSALSSLPPARHSLVPMNTPPVSLRIVSPLPSHLKHRRNHHHAEKQQISPSSVLIQNTPKVKGCGGMVRNSHDLTPRSGVGKTKSNGRRGPCKFKTQSFGCRFSREISRSRFKPLAPCGTSQKRNKPPKRFFAPASTPRQRRTVSTRTKAAEKFGPVTGQALRICFCQPHDGAGERGGHAENGCVGIAKGNIVNQCHDAGHAQEAREAESSENIRIVSGNKRARQKVKRRRSDSAASVGIKAGLLEEKIDKD